MKKWITMALCLLLTGCSTPAPESQAPVEEVPPTATETPVEEAPTVEMPADEVREAALHYEADTTLFADTLYAEDGTPLLNYTVRVPVLTVWREDGTQVTTAETETEKQALSAAETFGARFADWYQPENYAEMKAAAAEQLEWYRQEGMEWQAVTLWNWTARSTRQSVWSAFPVPVTVIPAARIPIPTCWDGHLM